jgi:hypothetical protein
MRLRVIISLSEIRCASVLTWRKTRDKVTHSASADCDGIGEAGLYRDLNVGSTTL